MHNQFFFHELQARDYRLNKDFVNKCFGMKLETFIKVGGTQLAFAFGHERCKFFSGRLILLI